MNQGAALAVIEDHFSEKAREILDEIFSNDDEIRDRITLLSPRRCHDREILLSVAHTDAQAVGKAVGRIVSWVRGGNFDRLNGLMLY